MTNGQIAQLQELRRCYMPSLNDEVFVDIWNSYQEPEFIDAWGYINPKMGKQAKAVLRRLMYQYRHQIKAMKRNRK